MKRDLRELLLAGRLEEVAVTAAHRKRVLGSLVSLTYDADPLVAWRAIESMGLACTTLAERDPDAVQEHMRRLNWLITEESGAICWRAPEAMAEIAARLPDLVSRYIPVVLSLMHEFATEDLEHFRAGVIWAIGRLASVGGDGITACLPDVVAALDGGDPQVRGTAVWCLGQIGRGDVLGERPRLAADAGRVQLYRNRNLVETNVGELVARVLAEQRGERSDSQSGMFPA